MPEAENKFILTLLTIITCLGVLQIVSIEYYTSNAFNPVFVPSENDYNTIKFPREISHDDERHKETNNLDISSEQQQQEVKLRSLEEILQRAGVEVTDEIREQLPPKEDVLSMYGSKPLIVGLDRCETFRNTIAKGDGFIGPAGMFNTGTNLLQTLLTNNCYLPDRVLKHGENNVGMRFQVPWGKHSPVSWRHKHSAPTMTKLNQTEFLPAVVIKDPYTWMDSMCRHAYAANWRHFEGHCPNLVPITPEEKEKLHGDETVKVNIRYRDTNITHHDSLADLWNTWYGDWMDVDFPRLIVRFEDLLFHAEYVLTQVCECAGGQLYNVSDFKYSVDSAKQGKAHKGANGLVKSITKYSDKAKRLKSFTNQDLSYSIKTLRSDLMETFGYVSPNDDVSKI